MARRAPENTRSELLDAAERCFAAHGLEATRVEDITGQIGIAKGAFYSYFESKDACWSQIIDAFLARLHGAVEVHATALRGTRAPLPERLAVWREHDLRMFEFCWENRAMIHMLTSGVRSASYAHLRDELANTCERRAEARVRELMAEGVYRDDLDPALVARLLGGAYDRLVRELIRARKRPDLASAVRKAQQLFMFGLLNDEARGEPVDDRT